MRPATQPNHPVVDGLTALFSMETVVVLYATWTLGFWFALALGRGWAVALPISVLLAIGLTWLRWRWPTQLDVRRRGDLSAMVVVFAIVVLWPVLYDLGRGTLAVLVVVLVVARLAIALARRSFGMPEVLLVAATALAAVVMVSYRLHWSLAVVGLGLIGLTAAVRPDLGGRAGLFASDPGPSSGWAGAAIESWLLGGFGVIIGIWSVGASPFWNPDNTYYVNKAEHYGASAGSFGVEDYLWGVDGVTHIPLGNILASYEPLVGVLAAGTGWSAFDTMFGLVVPLAMVAVPFAARNGARGLGVGRGGLVAALVVAAIVLGTAMNTRSLWANASLGKTVGQLVFIPLLFGAYGRLLRHPGRGTVLMATLAAICVIGVTPSMAIAALLVATAFSVAGWVQLWLQRHDVDDHEVRGRAIGLAVPLAVVSLYAILARALQASGGDAQLAAGFRRFDSPEAAWELAVGATRADLLAVFFLLGATGVVVIVSSSAAVRRAMGLLIVGVFVVLFSPWTFEVVITDLLDLNHFAWRFFWAIPATWLVGLVVANIDRRLGLSTLTVAAAVVAIGISGPDLGDTPIGQFRPQSPSVWSAPDVWPGDAGAAPAVLDAATRVVEATPLGGRYLAPSSVEQVATGIQIERLPTYARLNYVRVAAADREVPAAFGADDRVLLGQAVNGTIAEGTTVDDLARALDAIEVDTVCIGATSAEKLRLATTRRFSAAGSAQTCELWVR